MKVRWLSPCLFLGASCVSFAASCSSFSGDHSTGIDPEDLDAAVATEADGASDAEGSVVVPPEVDAGNVDAGTIDSGLIDAVDSGDAATPPGACTHDGFTSVSTKGQFASDDNWPYLEARSSLEAPTDGLSVLILPLTGSNEITAGMRAITAADMNYAVCTTCVSIHTKCDAALSKCEKMFIATDGVVEIKSAPEKGKVFQVAVDVTLAEVTMNPNTFETTLVPGGESWCLHESIEGKIE